MSIESWATTDRIVSALGTISLKKEVSIIYACESGSRAWGFASEDSDYDVRFIYAHHRDWYASIDSCSKRDVIDGMEFAGPEKLDVVGWDLRKALNLLRKGNAAFIEWLNSPIRYVDRYRFASDLSRMVDDHIHPGALVKHYVHMAFNNWRKYIKGRDEVLIKKYLYVMRPLCAAWYLMTPEVTPRPPAPPVEFEYLMSWIGLPAGVRDAVFDLIGKKKSGTELGTGPRIPVLDEFIESFDLTYGSSKEAKKGDAIPIDELNTLFREMLEVIV